jgi:hypothetical protein
MQNDSVEPSAQLDQFLRYIRRVQTQMLWIGGVVAIAGSVAASQVSGQASIQILLGGIALGGFCYAIVAIDGKVLLRRATKVLSEPSRRLELRTQLSRSTKSVTNNSVLAVLVDVISRKPSPSLVSKARWFSPGIAETHWSGADVFGGTEKGQVVLAITESGEVLGRVRRIDPGS